MVPVGNEALKRTENGRTVPVAQTDKLKLESLEPPPGLPHPGPPPLTTRGKVEAERKDLLLLPQSVCLVGGLEQVAHPSSPWARTGSAPA